ncbi:hypothetical protein L9F63_012701, partial [Diploptera punctata]
MKMSDNHDDSFTIYTKVQLSGILFKKSFAPHSNKWSKRFFIVKEGFLVYYSESEKKVFEKKGCFNIHPKGVIPVGGCIIQASSDAGQDHVIKILSDTFIHGAVFLGMETKYDQDRWVQALQEAARITWENCRMGESIIRDLESQGLQLNKEKQSYVDKLHEETIALRDEIDKNEELEKINMALDEEKQRLEQTIKDFQKQHEVMKLEYEETISAMKLVQQDKEALQTTTTQLTQTLSDLEEEKQRILKTMQQAEERNNKLNNSPHDLQEHLQDLEEEKRCILEEKQEIDERFQENELRAKVLEEEKQIISEHSNHLLSSLNDLLTQQDLTESELRLEVSARLEAERRLRLAQDSVHHLEGALETDISPSALRTKILPDVKKLRTVAEEARLDANMPVIMKNAVYARKTLANKSRSQLLEQTRQENAKTLGLDLDEIASVNAPLKRSLSIMITKKSLKPELSRTLSTRARNGTVFRANSDEKASPAT